MSTEGNWIWAKYISEIQGDNYSYDISSDSKNNIYLSGTFSGNMLFGNISLTSLYDSPYIINIVDPRSKIGVVNVSGLIGDLRDIIYQRIVSGYNGLIQGENYYLDDVNYQITTNDNPNNRLFGVAISNTELYLFGFT